MLSYKQMESFYRLVVSIRRSQETLSVTDGGLKAYQMNETPGGSRTDNRQPEIMVIHKEKAAAKLPFMKELKNRNLPFIEKTIREATEHCCNPALAIKRKMIFELRYMQGMDWQEITNCLQIKDPEKIIIQALERK